ncbi:hypothetical protein B0H16DRAFT_1879087 [Mycena metata]|uniref:F-box domain-containing protein n=1 Tax=Mycena metata TaxID=1033252 RepID=A0AAD7NWU4_9AGAR|nr:hypothetical protein B0H16DRAFT_1879087 [Mycena metata]
MSGRKSGFQKSYLIPTPSQVIELRDIIRTHSPPSVTLLSSVQSVVENYPLELARYAAEIQTLEEQLAELKSDRALIESYGDHCRSLSSPARRLPTELLVEIFDLCSPSSIFVTHTLTVEEEEERLGKKYLVRLSQWHGIVMKTPRLWSTIEIDTSVWKQSSSSSITLLALLASSLERGVEFPLTLSASLESNPLIRKSVLHLLGQHSRRWKRATFWLNPSDLGFLAHAKGNFPILEELLLLPATDRAAKCSAEVFSVAPRLETVEIHGWFGALPVLPWEQIRRLTIKNSRMLLMSMLPRLSTEARFKLVVHPAMLTFPLDLPPATSSIRSFKIGFSTEEFSTADSELDAATYLTRTGEILEEIFKSLTLLSLHTLRITDHLGSPPIWNAVEFSHFASRSALYKTLRFFQVRAIITDIELLEYLSVLPLLENLSIGDHATPGEEHIVITDSLLKGSHGGQTR